MSFAMSLFSTLGKECDLSFEQIWIFFTQDCDKFGWNLPNGSGEEEGQTDKGPQAIRKAHLSFQPIELKTPL